MARIVELPFGERPRERLLNKGPHSLQDAELIALVLRTGGGDRDAVALAQALLDRFGGVDGVLGQHPSTLLSVAGLGDAKVAALVAIRELLKRAEWTRIKGVEVLSSAAAVQNYLHLHIAWSEREVFGALLLDARHRLMAREDIFFGSVDRAAIYPREVVKCCLRHNAAAVVIYHNHPSGLAEPSAQDRKMTERLVAILDEVDVQVLDHVVIGRRRSVSMAEEGLLSAPGGKASARVSV